MTNWNTYIEKDKEPGTNTRLTKFPYYAKIVGAFVTEFLYFWVLIAPRCCTSRDFSDNE